MAEKLEFYGDSISGNCYKLQLACAELGLDYLWHELDILSGATRSEDFLKMNPNGKVPLMRLPDGRCLAESNAILSYLADGSPLQGGDRFGRASVLQWMCFEQYSSEPFIGGARFIVKYLGSPADRKADLEAKIAPGHKALAVMEQHLATQVFFANNEFSIADIALYAYTHVAHEGGFDLGAYPSVKRWLERIAARPDYVAMQPRSDGHQ